MIDNDVEIHVDESNLPVKDTSYYPNKDGTDMLRGHHHLFVYNYIKEGSMVISLEGFDDLRSKWVETEILMYCVQRKNTMWNQLLRNIVFKKYRIKINNNAAINRVKIVELLGE